MLTYLLYGLFLLSCFVLVVAVLLQPGKADAGALFTSSVSSTAFGPRGTASILAKITIAAATTFMLTALLLGFGVGGPRSVVDSAGTAVTPTPTPAATATPAADASPAASPQTAASPGASPAGAPAASPAASPAAGAGAAASPAASPAAATSPAR